MLTCKEVILYVSVLQSEHVGVGCVFGDILCRYSISCVHLFALNCASVLRVCLGSVCFSVHIFGEMLFITLLFVLICRRF